MCAIIDANVIHEVFGSKRTEAGEKFLDWINGGSGRLICGGELLEELKKRKNKRGKESSSVKEDSSERFEEWAKKALYSGRMKNMNDGEVKRRTEQIREESNHSSNDPHILALAQVSGARLLYSNDKKLHKDFKNRDLISPAGFIYSTLKSKEFTDVHQKLLEKKGLCSSAK